MITLFVVYIIGVVLSLGIQIGYEVFLNYEEEKIPWGLVIKQSFGYPYYLLKLIYFIVKR